MGFENKKSLKPTPRQSCQFIRMPIFWKRKPKIPCLWRCPNWTYWTTNWMPLILEGVKYTIIKSKTSTPNTLKALKKTQSAQPHPFPTNQPHQVNLPTPPPNKPEKSPRFPTKFYTNQPPPPWDITLSWIWFNAPRGGTPPQEKLSWGGKIPDPSKKAKKFMGCLENHVFLFFFWGGGGANDSTDSNGKLQEVEFL